MTRNVIERPAPFVVSSKTQSDCLSESSPHPNHARLHEMMMSNSLKHKQGKHYDVHDPLAVNQYFVIPIFLLPRLGGYLQWAVIP
jgi:hypothetical protein